MKTITRLKRFGGGAVAALAIVLAASAPGYAQARGGYAPGAAHAAPGGQHGGGHGGGTGHGDSHHDVHGHHEFHGSRHVGRFDHHPHFGVGFGFVPVFPDYGYYTYAPAPYESAPAYWYYCQSYGAYYPNVTSCPEAWVPVPAQ